MRFGISATSLMCPKNLRTRLRPVNVCCAIVASRYRRPLPKRHFQGAAVAVPRVEFRSISRAGRPSSGPDGPDFVLQTFKTQNDARGDLIAPPVRIISLRLAKARNCLSPNDLRRNTRLSNARRAFVLPPRYG